MFYVKPPISAMHSRASASVSRTACGFNESSFLSFYSSSKPIGAYHCLVSAVCTTMRDSFLDEARTVGHTLLLQRTPLIKCLQQPQRRNIFIFPKGTPTPAWRRTSGVPPGAGISLEQLLARKRAQLYDPEVDNPVNIGLPPLSNERTLEAIERNRKRFLKKRQFDPELERLARHRQLRVPLDEVEQEWQVSSGPDVMVDVANHYGVFRDLFGCAYFVPRIPLDIGYVAPSLPASRLTASLHASEKQAVGGQLIAGEIAENDAIEMIPVERGNVVMPGEAQQKPYVAFDPQPYTLGKPAKDQNGSVAPSNWSLMLLGLDSHATDTRKEYLHWFVANIPPNGDISAGEERVPYMPPLPYRGTGMQRYCFLLYKHVDGIDEHKRLLFDDVLPAQSSSSAFPANSLPARTFSTLKFYEHYQDRVTPAGLAFFLSEWDDSVTHYLYDMLDAKEPVFEYQHREVYINPHQNKYGVYLHGFNLYMDRYRNKQDMAEEMVKKRLKNTSPFARDPPRPRYPQAAAIDATKVPSWKRVEIYKERLGWVKYRLLYNPLARWP